MAAINVGTLGFLTCATANESDSLVDAIADGTYDSITANYFASSIYGG